MSVKVTTRKAFTSKNDFWWIFRSESSSRSRKCESVCHKKVWNFKILQDCHINIYTCQEWHVESEMLRVTGWEWHVESDMESDMSRGTCWLWQVKTYMLRVSCWVWGVTSDMSEVASRRDMSRVTSQKWQLLHNELRVTRYKLEFKC